MVFYEIYKQVYLAQMKATLHCTGGEKLIDSYTLETIIMKEAA